ncbi:hypothetical protein JCM8202_003658 [Rhodotorula sphaerocarpa]
MTLPQTRNILVGYLARGRSADAIAFFVDILDRNRGRWSAETAEGFAWLFVQYRQPALVRRAAAELHGHGFVMSTAYTSKLLRMHQNELVYEPEALAQVLEWLSYGLVREKHAGRSVDEGMLETVLDTLKRMGRTDWLEQVFKAYSDTLKPGETGSARLWSLRIGASLLDGDLRTAEKHFHSWRTGAVSESSPPSAAPYLVLLAYHAAKVRSAPVSRDPAYRFLALCHHDKVPLSCGYLDLLLRVELFRKRYSSFWGLWRAFDDPHLGLRRTRVSWLLAIRAQARSTAAARALTTRASSASPLHRLVPFAYKAASTPSSRALFRQLLADRLAHTFHRPFRRLPTHGNDSLDGAEVLNGFLERFIAERDWPAATVVLETFRVHRVEPDFRTHGNVVLGVVNQWRRGKVAHGHLDDPLGTAAASSDGPHAFEDPQLAHASRSGLAGIRSDREGLELVRKILDGRKMRLNLWRRSEVASPEEGQTAVGGFLRLIDDDGAEDELDNPAPVTSRWMAQRERRDLEYLIALLRRCEGGDEAEWPRIMAETREEMLPPPKDTRAPEAESNPVGRKMQRESRGKRHRAAMREAARHRKEKQSG